MSHVALWSTRNLLSYVEGLVRDDVVVHKRHPRKGGDGQPGRPRHHQHSVLCSDNLFTRSAYDGQEAARQVLTHNPIT